MAELSWLHWLTFDGLQAVHAVSVPTLLVHGDGCMLKDNVKRRHAALRGEKRLVWTDGFQVDFYDQPALVEKAVTAVDDHFRRTL